MHLSNDKKKQTRKETKTNEMKLLSTIMIDHVLFIIVDSTKHTAAKSRSVKQRAVNADW